MKTCTNCQTSKELNQFYHKHSYCKECSSLKHKEWYQNNKERLHQKYLDNQQNKLNYQKEYNEKNKDRLKKYHQQYYRNNKAICK